MIQWSEHLFLYDVINQKKLNKIKKSIENGKLTFEVYCIAIASNKENLFDIYNANELLFRYYASKHIFIVGIAFSKEDAFTLVTQILNKIYIETGEFSIRTYFQCEERFFFNTTFDETEGT